MSKDFIDIGKWSLYDYKNDKNKRTGPFSGVDKKINGTPNSRRDMSGLRGEHQ